MTDRQDAGIVLLVIYSQLIPYRISNTTTILPNGAIVMTFTWKSPLSENVNETTTSHQDKLRVVLIITGVVGFFECYVEARWNLTAARPISVLRCLQSFQNPCSFPGPLQDPFLLLRSTLVWVPCELEDLFCSSNLDLVN